MTSFLLSIKEGKLCVDGHWTGKQETKGVFNTEQFKSGDLSITASKDNIITVSQCFLDLFIKPISWNLEQNPIWRSNITMDAVREYREIEHEDNSNPKSFFKQLTSLFLYDKNLTRGWCYLATATLHRFFYKQFVLFRNTCEYSDDDYHWWLQDGKRVIDLTEEQYKVKESYALRLGGRKKTPLGKPYSLQTRNLASMIASELSNSFVDPDKILIRGYHRV